MLRMTPGRRAEGGAGGDGPGVLRPNDAGVQEKAVR
jgi:hypothetical protein